MTHEENVFHICPHGNTCVNRVLQETLLFADKLPTSQVVLVGVGFPTVKC